MDKILKGPSLELNWSSVKKGNLFLLRKLKICREPNCPVSGKQPHTTVLRNKCNSGGDVVLFVCLLFCFAFSLHQQ